MKHKGPLEHSRQPSTTPTSISHFLPSSKECTPPNVHPTQICVIRRPLNHLLHVPTHTQRHTFSRQHPPNLASDPIQNAHRRVRHACHAGLLPLPRIDKV